MPTGAQSRFSLARADGVRAFPRLCLSTKAAVSAPRFDRPLATKLADTEQRASSRNTGRPRFRLEQMQQRRWHCSLPCKALLGRSRGNGRADYRNAREGVAQTGAQRRLALWWSWVVGPGSKLWRLPCARRRPRAPVGAATVESGPGRIGGVWSAGAASRDRYSDRVLSQSRCPGALLCRP
jgi:hypothetical protein